MQQTTIADCKIIDLRNQNPKIKQKNMIQIKNKIDWHEVGEQCEVYGKIYFGEYTFFHHFGIAPFHPDEWDFIWGEQIHLLEANV